jgi:hypothetical protein
MQYFVSICQALEEGVGVEVEAEGEAEAEVFIPDPFPTQRETLPQQAEAGECHIWRLVTKRITTCT